MYNCMPALEANHSGEKWRHNSLILPQSWQRLMSMVILPLPCMFAPWLFSYSSLFLRFYYFFWHHDHQYTQAVIGCSTYICINMFGSSQLYHQLLFMLGTQEAHTGSFWIKDCHYLQSLWCSIIISNHWSPGCSIITYNHQDAYSIGPWIISVKYLWNCVVDKYPPFLIIHSQPPFQLNPSINSSLHLPHQVSDSSVLKTAPGIRLLF